MNKTFLLLIVGLFIGFLGGTFGTTLLYSKILPKISQENKQYNQELIDCFNKDSRFATAIGSRENYEEKSTELFLVYHPIKRTEEELTDIFKNALSCTMKNSNMKGVTIVANYIKRFEDTLNNKESYELRVDSIYHFDTFVLAQGYIDTPSQQPLLYFHKHEGVYAKPVGFMEMYVGIQRQNPIYVNTNILQEVISKYYNDVIR